MVAVDQVTWTQQYLKDRQEELVKKLERIQEKQEQIQHELDTLGHVRGEIIQLGFALE